MLTYSRLQNPLADAESHCSGSKACPTAAPGPTTSNQGSPGEGDGGDDGQVEAGMFVRKC